MIFGDVYCSVMPVIIPPDHAQVTFDLISPSFESGLANVTLGIRLTGGAVGATMGAVALGVAEDFETNLLAPLSSLVTVQEVRAVDEDSFGAVTPGLVGGNSVNMPPSNVALLVRKATARRGPRGRGRMYWPHMVEEATIDPGGNITGSTVTALQGLFDAFRDDLLARDFVPVVLQGDNPGQQSPPINPPPAITRFLVEPKVATQRGRMR